MSQASCILKCLLQSQLRILGLLMGYQEAQAEELPDGSTMSEHKARKPHGCSMKTPGMIEGGLILEQSEILSEGD